SLQAVGGPTLRYRPVRGTQGPAGARNIGWRAARGKIIAFTDDDCMPSPKWLAEGVRAIEDQRADAATGTTRVPLPHRPTDGQRDAAGLATAEFVTANCFCRRAALAAIDGFDERFTLAWREDSDLQFTLLERGMKIVRAERAVVIHPVRPMAWGVSLRQQRKGVFDPLLYRKHPVLYRRRLTSLPRSYYGIAACLAAVGLGAAIEMPSVALLGLGGWLAMTGVFAAKRIRGASRHPRHIAEMIVTSALIPLLSIYWRLRGVWRYRVLHF
ncbi:MAG: glycosyltransferase family 2 protein, partial [Planctomycetaceae bacterium]|nr:glycosyltransferase family 2 protein [Planctomycetaceae bacterium]